MTRRAHAERAIETLAAGKPKSVGAVLNHLEARWDTTEPVARSWP